MFVIKFTDKLTGSWSFQVNGLYQNIGCADIFDKSSCYQTRDDALNHIKNALVNPDCGRWRDDVDESYFEIVEVYPIPGLLIAYSTINYEKERK